MSPDINPIKHISDRMDWQLPGNSSRYSSSVGKLCEELFYQDVNNLINRMTRQVVALMI